MSKLAELLKSRGALPATPVTPATHGAESSSSSKSSSNHAAKTHFVPDLERRIRAMAERWQYTQHDLEELLDLVRADPAAWLRAAELDERREAEFRERGILPRTDA